MTLRTAIHLVISMAIGLGCIALAAAPLPPDVRPAVLFMAFLPGIIYIHFAGVGYRPPDRQGQEQAAGE